jgi:tetratricopeptide (TPR) repeat protein
MNRFCPVFLLLALAATGGFAQSGQSPDGQSTSRPQPDAPPSPPDAPIPDQGSLPATPPKSATKRAINKLDPHCIDAIFHTCWSSPAAVREKPMSEGEREAANDIEVGYYYLREKNYVAAESRLKEAVEIKPDSPQALIGLAQAQQKLGKRNDARQNYEAYLKLNPNGPDAEKVRNALAQLK